MKIRKSTLNDFKEIYNIGLNTPEIKTSSTVDFMEKDELKDAIKDKNSIFLVVEERNKIIGFEYATIKDLERPYSCLIYIVVIPEFRRKGIASKLYKEMEKRLKEKKVNFVYCWANIKGNGKIVGFRKKQDFKEGHKYVWMDKRL